MRRRYAAALLAVVALLTACTEDGSVIPEGPRMESRVEVDTPELRQLRTDAGIADCPKLEGPGSELPDIELPCLGGGPAVRLSEVSGPAVVTVWAQWCGPCRKELPWFEQLHQQAGDRLTVLGVNWQDVQPAGALEFAAHAGVTFPSVADLDTELPGVRGLPVLYLVDGAGQVETRPGQVADYAELSDLVEQHTGVRVGRR